jgi:hypothetical protein
MMTAKRQILKSVKCGAENVRKEVEKEGKDH